MCSLFLSRCCMAVLFEPIAGAHVDGKYSCADLLSARLPSATAFVMHVARCCRFAVGAERPDYECPSTNRAGAVGDRCRVRWQLPRTFGPTQRRKAGYRLEVPPGMPVASRES